MKNTPFTDKQRPSVGLIITTEADETDLLKVIVAQNQRIIELLEKLTKGIK